MWWVELFAPSSNEQVMSLSIQFWEQIPIYFHAIHVPFVLGLCLLFALSYLSSNQIKPKSKRIGPTEERILSFNILAQSRIHSISYLSFCLFLLSNTCFEFRQYEDMRPTLFFRFIVILLSCCFCSVLPLFLSTSSPVLWMAERLLCEKNHFSARLSSRNVIKLTDRMLSLTPPLRRVQHRWNKLVSNNDFTEQPKSQYSHNRYEGEKKKKPPVPNKKLQFARTTSRCK